MPGRMVTRRPKQFTKADWLRLEALDGSDVRPQDVRSAFRKPKFQSSEPSAPGRIFINTTEPLRGDCVLHWGQKLFEKSTFELHIHYVYSSSSLSKRKAPIGNAGDIDPLKIIREDIRRSMKNDVVGYEIEEREILQNWIHDNLSRRCRVGVTPMTYFGTARDIDSVILSIQGDENKEILREFKKNGITQMVHLRINTADVYSPLRPNEECVGASKLVLAS